MLKMFFLEVKFFCIKPLMDLVLRQNELYSIVFCLVGYKRVVLETRSKVMGIKVTFCFFWVISQPREEMDKLPTELKHKEMVNE